MKSFLTDFFDRHAGFILSAPALFLLMAFVIYPFLSALRDSFTNLSMFTIPGAGKTSFIALENYTSLFQERDFLSSFMNTFYFVIIVVPIQAGLAFTMAITVNGSKLWQKVLRISFFLPVITSMAVLSVVWSLLYNPTSGPFNVILSIFNIPPQHFLNSPSQAMLCIGAMSIWQGVGFQMMIYLAGLQTIPRELFEAAKAEGAGKFQQVWHITIPLLKNTTIFVIIITTIFASKLFVQPHLLTRGGPGGSTKTLILKLYDEAFINGNYGLACAISIVFFLIVLLLTAFQRLILPRETKS